MLRPADKSNFETLRRAIENGQVALLEVKRRSDGAEIAAVCAVDVAGAEYTLTPFATMVEGNPFDLFLPPSAEGGFVGDGEDQ
jgi:hypothetical protein